MIEFLPADDVTEVPRIREARAPIRRHDAAEHRAEADDRRHRVVDISISSPATPGNKSFEIVLTQDITKRKAAEDALRAQAELSEYQALHDSLTDMPNRTLFRDRLGQAIEAVRRQKCNAAILMIDLDGFKEINDSIGHAGGDEVLVEVSRRLRAVIRGGDTAARLGGDEFALLLPDVRVPEDVERVVARVREAFAQPIIALGRRVAINVPIGIAVAPTDSESIDALLLRRRRRDVPGQADQGQPRVPSRRGGDNPAASPRRLHAA